MKRKIFNVVWQSLKKNQPPQKGKKWKLNTLLKIVYCIWKLLKFLFDEGEAS